MDEFNDDFENMYETEMEMARELEMDFIEANAPAPAAKAASIPVIKAPTIPTVKRNLFSLEDVENSSIAANSSTTSQNASLTFKPPSSQVLATKGNKISRVEDSLNRYLDLLNSPRRKKQKLEGDEDANIISRILAYRQDSEESKPVDVAHLKKTTQSGSLFWGQTTIHKHLPAGDFVSVTTGDGKRFYLDLIKEEKFHNLVTNFTTLKSNTTLLEEPYALLKLKAENEQLQMKQNEKIYALKQVAVDQQDNEASKEILWVDKYRPNHYLDLLSDEGTNKTVLRWLKLWDKVVFGNDFLARRNERQANKDIKPTFFTKSVPDVIEKLDVMGIPEQKVILLCGPPGLGKTTLAHVIARHAGYNVLEMNASDDRSTDAFKRSIDDATSMKAVMGKERRPNCLVIDEIDGAPTASISLLVNLLQGKKGQKEQKGKKQAKILKRPVICICNDLYTLSLRALRQMALIVRFMPTQSVRLIDRLNTISIKQNLHADLTVLRTLCNKTENDIRSCLSVLQFIKASSGRLRFSDLDGVSVGQKDYQRSLFTGWQEIFTIPPAKKKVFRNVHQEGVSEAKTDDEKPQSRFSRIHRLVSACGEYDKLTQGWFENYPNTKFKHTHLEPVVKGLEWATTSDIIQVEIHHSQAWILMKYLSYAFVSYHLLFATHQRPKLVFPMQFGEHISKLAKCTAVVSAMASEMLPYTRFFSNSSTLVYDLIPYIMVIIQPQMRPVNIHLYSQNEKETFAKLVSSMINYNLTYQQERSAEGQYSFNLDPDIENVAYYDGISKGKSLSYSCRQLVAREIEMEKLRRADNYFTGSLKEKSNRQESIVAKKPPTKPAIPAVQPKKLADNKPVLKEAQVPRDFFGRKIVIPATENNTQSDKNTLTGDIWFKFKEGYSNAVRRPIKLRDLLS